MNEAAVRQINILKLLISSYHFLDLFLVSNSDPLKKVLLFKSKIDTVPQCQSCAKKAELS